MANETFKYRSLLKPFQNIFIVISIIFCIWMLFFDTHSFFLHRDLNREKEKLKTQKEYYKKEIERDKKELEELSTEEGIERYGREHYNMKKENEEIYIIEYEDSTKTQQKQ